MSRGLTTAMEGAVDAVVVRPAHFVKIRFASGDMRAWSGAGEYTFGGEIYTGVGQLGEVSPIGEASDVSALGIQLKLSGIPSELLSVTLSDDYRGRPVTVWLALFDDAGSLLADPEQVFAGLVDTMSLEDAGDTASITLTAESRLVDLERPRELRYTDAEQQRLYPGDLGLRYVASLADKELPWGIASASSSQGGQKTYVPGAGGKTPKRD